jgi:hypothetical protein
MQFLHFYFKKELDRQALHCQDFTDRSLVLLLINQTCSLQGGGGRGVEPRAPLQSESIQGYMSL